MTSFTSSLINISLFASLLLFVYLLYRQDWKSASILFFVSVVITVYLSFALGYPGDIEYKGSNEYGRIVLCYIFMLAGIIFEHLYRIVLVRSSRKQMMRSILASCCISPLIFHSFLQTLMETSSTMGSSPQEMVAVLFVAFQNGWFWRTIFHTLEQSHDTSTTQ